MITDIKCPHCKGMNWVNLGDMEDMTIGNPDGAVCVYCRKSFYWDADFEFEKGEDFVQGYATPNEAAGIKL